MSIEYLKQSDAAQRRAKQLMECGEPGQACDAYLEAATQMLRFAGTQQGEKQKNALWLAEQLIEDGRLAGDDAQKQNEARVAGIAAAAERKIAAAAQTPDPPAPPAQPDPPAPPVKPADPARPSPPARPEKPAETQTNNSSAISRDLKSWQQRGSRMTSDAENRMKFVPVESPNVHFSDIAGLENVKSLVRLKVIEPILHPELYERFDKTMGGGILLYGPPGTGKTMIARAVATETGLDFFSVRCSDIVGKSFGDGERNLKGLFDAARESGRAMIFFDEFESLACKRGGGSTVMNRIVPELLSQMDGFQQADGLLVVLASTNRPWDLDSAVLRPPRMTERIYVGLPDFPARHYMVKKALEELPKESLLDYDRMAEALEGFNCADIAAFVERVKEAPIRRGLREPDVPQFITVQDVEDALAASHSSVQKSDLEAFGKWEATQH